MAHRIDPARIADSTAARAAVKAAIVRLTQIETASTATAAQVRQAVQDMAGYLKHIIKLVT
jgi:hypothetical protein